MALYIDKWYIVGAICVDGTARPVRLPNNEDRVWLFFHEDVSNDTISYGKGFDSHYRNRENHYYGDVFANLTDSAAKFTIFETQLPIKDIFKMGKVFDDLKAAIGNEDNVPTYLSFSKDIGFPARLIFMKELEKEGFKIEISVAMIDHLALEYAVKKKGFPGEGNYLVLNACNENLRYSVYKKSGDIFSRMADDVLPGKGEDSRRRCLIKYIVDSINRTEIFLQTDEEKEAEYSRCSQFVENWILKISNARPHIPVQITDVTLSKDPHKTYSVAVRRKQIDEMTETIAKSLVDVIVRFVRANGIRHEEVSGIVFLGNTFTNKQFTTQFLNRYDLHENRMICYMDKDLWMLVGAYDFIDCGQFKERESNFRVEAENELDKIKKAEEERIDNEKAQAEAEATAKNAQARKEEEAKFRQAMDRGYESETNHDYESMAEYFEIARNLRPDDEEAVAKYKEALRLKTEQSVMLKKFKEQLSQAKAAMDEKDWELAKQKATEALGSNPDSQEARRIKDEANRQIAQKKDFDRYIDRADLFIARNLYEEAKKELEKARLLGIDDEAVKSRLDKIKKLEDAFKSRVEKLVARLNEAVGSRNYDEAIRVCRELREVDSTNQIKWTNKLAELNSLRQREKERIERVRALKSEIDTALWDENWKEVVEKCKELLAVSPEEDGIKEKLARAESKLKTAEVKASFDKAVSDIKDLIERAGFKEAKAKLNSLSKEFTGREEQARIRDLRKLLFERENECESTGNTGNPRGWKTGTKPFDDFFGDGQPKRPVARTAEGAARNHGKKADDFFGASPTSKGTTSETRKKTNEDYDDFFNS